MSRFYFNEWVKMFQAWTPEAKSKSVRRKNDFKPYVEPFRPLNDEEIKSLKRSVVLSGMMVPYFLVSYQAQTGGFTICNIILDNKLYSGSSHCSKVDRWLPIRGKMLAFRRAFESEGVEISSIEQQLVTETKEPSLNRSQFLKQFLNTIIDLKEIPASKADQIISLLRSLKEG